MHNQYIIRDQGQGAASSWMRYTILCVENMSELKHQVYCSFQQAPGHTYPGHPESPKRLQGMTGWMANSPYPEIEWLVTPPADEGDVALVHHPAMLAELAAEINLGAHEFEPSPSYVTQDSHQAAFGAVGAVLSLNRQIISDGEGRGFAIVRPPGHHADPDASMGFCLFNNIAIAAADAVASGLSRVAIFDFDAHHGNGTESAFWNTPQVGYFSTHESNTYPGTGSIQSASHARGRIINFPLPAFTGNTAFFAILEQVVKPWLRNFRPQMLFVSAGFDAHFSDPLTTLTLDTDGFYQITKTLVALANEFCCGRLLYALEGGYDPLALKDNIQACLAAMCGHESYPDHYGKGPGVRPDVQSLIDQVKMIHQLEEN